MSPAPRRRIAALAVAVLVAVGAACGGDDDSGDSSATTAATDETTTTATEPTTATDGTTATDETTGDTATDETTGDTATDETTADTSSDETTEDTATDGTTESTESTGTEDTTEGSVLQPGNLEVIDPGADEGRIQLPGSAEVGQTGSGSATINLAVKGLGQDATVGIVLEYDAEVTEADDTGYTSETTITDAQVLDAPEGADVSEFEAIVGVTYSQTFSADGTPGETQLVNQEDLSAEQIMAFESFGASLSSTAALTYPSTPVGAGARWVSSTPIQSQGIELTVDYEYELLSVNGSDYEMAVTYAQDVDEQVEQGGTTAQLTGTVSGEGSVNGSVENPLQNNTELVQDFDMTIDAAGQSVDATVHIEVILESS